jgi:hypothetical protein
LFLRRILVDGPGSLVRIGANTLVTSDPDQVRKMLGVRTQYKRSNWYVAMRLDPSRDNVLSERDDDKHNALRSKMAAGASTLLNFASTDLTSL